ncbi:MAG: hypothetical protein ACP5P1_02460 [Acidimicrobiales bacterium]
MFSAAESAPDLSKPDLSGPRQLVDGSGFGRADRAVAALLKVPLGRPTATESQAQSLFRTSIAVSAVRCLISYLAVPIALPFLGTLSNVGPVVEIILSVVALFFDVKALRRFWLAWHAWRWGMTFVYAVVMVLVGVLLVSNVASIA